MRFRGLTLPLCLLTLCLVAPCVAAQDQSSADDADTSAASAAIQKMLANGTPSTSSQMPVKTESAVVTAVHNARTDAQNMSSQAAKALEDLKDKKNPDPDDADVSAALAVVKQKADQFVASTPTDETIQQATNLQRIQARDAESKSDLDLFKNCLEKLVPDINSDLGNLDGTIGPDNMVKAVTCALTPSYTGGPSSDEVPVPPDEEQAVNNYMNKYSSANQDYQQSLQNLFNALQVSPIEGLPTPAQVQQSKGPQIVNGRPNQPQVPAKGSCTASGVCH
jgi:hypothetical protein